MLATNYPILDIFLTTLYFFIFIIWLWLLFMVFIDIFRSHDLHGWAKALWVIGIIVMPYLGVLVYLIFRGGKMHERAAQQAAQQQKAFDQYVKQAAGTPGAHHRRPALEAGRAQDARASSPMPNSRPRSPRSWPVPERGRDATQHKQQHNRRAPDRTAERRRGDTMTIGPVSYTVIAFPGNQFNGNIAPEVAKLVASGTVRILDLVFVAKDEQGDTISLEFDQMDELAAFNDIDGEVGGLVNAEDLDHVAANLPEGNSALVILWEDLWAVPLVEAIRGSGGVLIDSARIPNDLIEAAFEELAQALKS